MTRVTGIGGIFFKAADQKAQIDWYREHLGVEVSDEGHAMYWWREDDDPDKRAYSVWALFPRDTTYFSPGSAPFMINYRVDNLDALLSQLREEGVQVDDRVEESEYGRFGWIIDPEGNRIELWEPPSEE
jgi:catechol 2,3-dioxygenase-like lactoylglutathione lyase family enzyme